MQKIVKIATAGSVDDGKSTLIARLLLDSDSLPEDLRPKDTLPGTLANLLDGLELERQQGITIDVAHRFFDSGDVRFHLMDSPGHEQYTRNMATAASGADALMLLISANEGVKPQTLNHLRVAKLVGVRNFIIVVNKLDLVRNRVATIREVRSQIESEFDFSSLRAEFIGVIATTGENVVRPSKRLAIDNERSLLAVLHDLAVEQPQNSSPSVEAPTIVSIQHVLRANGRRFFGEVLSGNLSEGQILTVAGSTNTCTIGNLHVSGSRAQAAVEGAQVSFELAEDRDVARGDLLTEGKSEKISTFTANLVWLDQDPGLLKRRYLLQVGQQRVSCRISKIKSVEAENEDTVTSPTELSMNSVAKVEIVANSPILLDANGPESLKRLILIDPQSASTCAAGVALQVQRRSQNLISHGFDIDPRKWAAQLGFQGKVIWLTGLSGSGKSTIANSIASELSNRGLLFAIIDGDSLRQGLNRDLGFTDGDRVENIRRAAEVAKMMVNSGLVVIVALVSPFRSDREDAKEIVGNEDFLEVFVDAPLSVCEGRDPKGLYKKARAGQIPNFTGIDSAYEPPLRPGVRIDTTCQTPDQAAEEILKLIRA